MANSGQSVLERIHDVYGEARKYLPFEQTVKSQMSGLENTHRLYFNSAYPGGRIGRLGKKIFQKLTNPVLSKQVEFNATVREILTQTVAAVTDLEYEVKDLTAKTHLSEERRLKNGGLWFNQAVKAGFREDGTAYWQRTTPQIIEKAFVMQSLARLYPTAEINVLDVGATESLLAFELASLGYSVTATDLRPITLSHPNLKFVKGDICKPVFDSQCFDCVTAISVLEHIGLDWYGDEGENTPDVQAVQQIYRLLKPGGCFILTIPYGKEAVTTSAHRIYNDESLQRLVEPFKITHEAYAIQRDAFTVVVTPDQVEAADKMHDPETFSPGAMAMLVCVKMETSA